MHMCPIIFVRCFLGSFGYYIYMYKDKVAHIQKLNMWDNIEHYYIEEKDMATLQIKE